MTTDDDAASVQTSRDELWVRDDTSSHCFGCEREFSFARRRHHCRRCGGLYCGGCSRNSMSLSALAMDGGPAGREERVCDDCWSSHQERLFLRSLAAEGDGDRGGDAEAAPVRRRGREDLCRVFFLDGSFVAVDVAAATSAADLAPPPLSSLPAAAAPLFAEARRGALDVLEAVAPVERAADVLSRWRLAGDVDKALVFAAGRPRRRRPISGDASHYSEATRLELVQNPLAKDADVRRFALTRSTARHLPVSCYVGTDGVRWAGDDAAASCAARAHAGRRRRVGVPRRARARGGARHVFRAPDAAAAAGAGSPTTQKGPPPPRWTTPRPRRRRSRTASTTPRPSPSPRTARRPPPAPGARRLRARAAAARARDRGAPVARGRARPPRRGDRGGGGGRRRGHGRRGGAGRRGRGPGRGRRARRRRRVGGAAATHAEALREAWRVALSRAFAGADARACREACRRALDHGDAAARDAVPLEATPRLRALALDASLADAPGPAVLDPLVDWAALLGDALRRGPDDDVADAGRAAPPTTSGSAAAARQLAGPSRPAAASTWVERADAAVNDTPPAARAAAARARCSARRSTARRRRRGGLRPRRRAPAPRRARRELGRRLPGDAAAALAAAADVALKALSLSAPKGDPRGLADALARLLPRTREWLNDDADARVLAAEVLRVCGARAFARASPAARPPRRRGRPTAARLRRDARVVGLGRELVAGDAPELAEVGHLSRRARSARSAAAAAGSLSPPRFGSRPSAR
ncbi:hypothetical protein JL721_5249 [Aureococcus anophagefferens]|nr:hypothetical protein JL721_5249 [Aureococcus anophagefferens]